MDDRFNRIFELARAAELIEWDELPSGALTPNHLSVARARKFAELIVRECVNTLEFHGFDDAIPYIRWMATNKLGV